MNGTIKKIIGRLKNMISKAIVNAVVDSGQIQLIKVEGLEGEVIDNVERLQNFGHTSNPPEGGEVILACIGGNKDHPVAIVVDGGKYRLRGLKPGESALYDKTGSTVFLKEDGSIVITPSNNVFSLKSDKINLGAESLLATAGVVTGECLDPVTGVPFPDKSSKVFAKK